MFRSTAVRTILTTLAVLFGLTLLPAQPASACIWNWQHNFSPFPPCDVEDMPARKRLSQTNDRVLAKITTVAQKVHQVRREITAWQRTIDMANYYEYVLKRTFGDLTASPLPSLIAEYNRNNPMARYVKLQPDGEFGVSADPVDMKELGEMVKESFQNAVGLDQLYLDIRNDIEQKTMSSRALGSVLEQQLTNLGQYEYEMESTLDSLRRTSNNTSRRYSGLSSTRGMSEAEISTLSATLSKLRGTAFGSQASALRSQVRMLSAMTDTRRSLRQATIDQNPTYGF